MRVDGLNRGGWRPHEKTPPKNQSRKKCLLNICLINHFYKKKRKISAPYKKLFFLYSVLTSQCVSKQLQTFKRMFYRGWLMICWFGAFPHFFAQRVPPPRGSALEQLRWKGRYRNTVLGAALRSAEPLFCGRTAQERGGQVIAVGSDRNLGFFNRHERASPPSEHDSAPAIRSVWRWAGTTPEGLAGTQRQSRRRSTVRTGQAEESELANNRVRQAPPLKTPPEVSRRDSGSSRGMTSLIEPGWKRWNPIHSNQFQSINRLRNVPGTSTKKDQGEEPQSQFTSIVDDRVEKKKSSKRELNARNNW